MSQPMSRRNIEHRAASWDEAIADARAALQRIERKVVQLREAIKTFEQSKAEGEPWPCTKTLEIAQKAAENEGILCKATAIAHSWERLARMGHFQEIGEDLFSY